MPFSSLHLLAVAASAVLALGLTPLVQVLARRYGMIATPKTDRWHKKPTAMFGGVAIWLAVVVSYLVFIRPATGLSWMHFPGSFLDDVVAKFPEFKRLILSAIVNRDEKVQIVQRAVAGRCGSRGATT